MDGRLTRTNCDEAGNYVVPNVLSPRDLVSRPDNMDETVLSSSVLFCLLQMPSIIGKKLHVYEVNPATMFYRCSLTLCLSYLSLDVRKPVFGVFVKVQP